MKEITGFGICTDGIVTTPERIKSLLERTPRMKGIVAEFEDFKRRRGFADGSNGYQIANLLEGVIKELEDVRLEIFCDNKNRCYLLLPPAYPWTELTDGEKKLVSEKVCAELFNRYVKELTDKEIPVGEQVVTLKGQT
jgi:hypothetical protein